MPKTHLTVHIDGHETQLTFAPLKAGFMREHRDLMKRAVLHSSVDDLIEQLPIVTESLRPAHLNRAEELVDALDVPDLAEAIRKAMEASGFVYVAAKPGEDAPTKR